jgi:hypothetical protein
MQLTPTIHKLWLHDIPESLPENSLRARFLEETARFILGNLTVLSGFNTVLAFYAKRTGQPGSKDS